MADKPLYYGSSKSSPMYYGGNPAPGGRGGKPMYYGAGSHYGQYGGAPYGGIYGGTSGAPGENQSVVGTLTIQRILRVISQRWLSVFVFLLVGIICAFAIYKISPTIYEAKSEFTMDMRRSTASRGMTSGVIDQAMVDYGTSYDEVFNTRLSAWRSEKIITMIVAEYRSNFPSSVVPEDELIATLSGSLLELQRNSRIITIAVRSQTPALAAALANAYAKSIEALTDEENKMRCDKAVAQLHTNVEKQRREVEKVSKNLLEFRTAHKIDNLRSARDTAQQSLSKTTADILLLETQETQLVEWEKMLTEVTKDPQNFGALSTGIPRAQEIANEYKMLQDATGQYESLQLSFTENHPEVVASKKVMELAKQRFLDATSRALQTGQSTLIVTRNQLSSLRKKREELTNELASLGQRILLAESGLGILEADFGVANRVMEDLIMQENKARSEAEANNEIITLGRKAIEPRKPVLPNPLIIFGAGIALSLALGIFFVLVLDNLEDTIVNLSDIEGRLALKVLAVFPHVRRKKREQVAKFLVDEKYSQFSEAVAGLRNLLDSPRYQAMSNCLLLISTQPAEGKTITSNSIAISYAQTGKKVLLVDFDLRRPRLNKIWNLSLTEEDSFSHYLQRSSDATPNFEKLVKKSTVDNLDLIGSLPPEGITPSTIFGSKIVENFFEWAREKYDRIIVDAPPYGLVGDVVSLAVHVDGIVVMCCPDRTHFKPIQYATRSLTEAGANILGVIVNDVEVTAARAFTQHSHGRYGGYGYGGYGGYGYGYGYGPKKSRKKKVTEPTTGEVKEEPKEVPTDFTDDE